MAALLALLLMLWGVFPTAALSLKGFSFAAEGWAHPAANYSSARARNSLIALRDTGATAVRVLVTAYVDSESDTNIHTLEPPSPLAASTQQDVAAFCAFAAGLNLTVVLSPTVDINWDVPANAPLHAWYAQGGVSRNGIGAGWGEPQWDAFFASYASFLLPWAAMAQAALPSGDPLACNGVGIAMLSIGDEMDEMWGQAARMRALIASVRAVYHGCLTAASNGRTLQSIT